MRIIDWSSDVCSSDLVPGLVASAVAIAGPAIFSDAAMAGQTTQVGPGSVVQSAPPVIQTVPPQTPGATPIVPGPLGQGLPPVVQPADRKSTRLNSSH